MAKYRWSIRKWDEKEQAKTGFTYLVTDTKTKEVYCFRSESILLCSKENDELHLLPYLGYPNAFFAVNYLLARVRDYCNNLLFLDSYPEYSEVEEIIDDWSHDAIWRRIE